MTKLILAAVAAFPLIYIAYFILAVRWRLEKDRRARADRRRQDVA